MRRNWVEGATWRGAENSLQPAACKNTGASVPKPQGTESDQQQGYAGELLMGTQAGDASVSACGTQGLREPSPGERLLHRTVS